MKTVIQGVSVFTGEAVLDSATVIVDGESIGTILTKAESTDAALAGAAQTIRGSGRLVTPGLVNAHTHAYSSLARGISLPGDPPANFPQVLENLWWNLDAALDLEAISLSAKLHALECLKGGVTSVFDHHASQTAISCSLEIVARAFSDSGLRACLCFEVSDRAGIDASREGIEENLSFIRSVGQGSRSAARFGLHSSFTLSDETLAECTRHPEAVEAGFHIHVAEHPMDQEDSARRSGERVVQRLARHGVLGPRTICAHGIHLDDSELEVLARSRSWLAHCPESNMNNAVGAVDLARLDRAGVRLCLGTDGFTAQIAREALVASLLQSHASADPRAGQEIIPGLLFGANQALASETFGIPLGVLKPGAPADLVVWDYRPPTPLTKETLWGHVAFGLSAARASDVFVAGRHALREGRSASYHEDDLAAQFREAARRLWERM